MAIVSIKSQQVTWYEFRGWIDRAPVSTGVEGTRDAGRRGSPSSRSDKDHHSTMYDDAWMPNMQRITWNGLALHGGPLPGYAASTAACACLRLCGEAVRQNADRHAVIVSPEDATPVDISHPVLFTPNPAIHQRGSGKGRDARPRCGTSRRSGR